MATTTIAGERSTEIKSTNEETIETTETSTSSLTIEHAEEVTTETTKVSQEVTKNLPETTSKESVQTSLPTLHNIYKNSQEVIKERGNKIKITSNKSKLNKTLYSKLHRKNHGKSHVNKLKGKFEEEPTKETKEIETEQNIKEVSTESTPNNTSIEVIADVTDNITKLQSNLSVKLKKDTVEELRNKYSPSNFGFPKLPSPNRASKKVQFSPEPTKIPIPKPRNSLKKSKEEAKKSEEAEPKIIEVKKVKLKIVVPETPSITYINKEEKNKKDENENDLLLRRTSSLDLPLKRPSSFVDTEEIVFSDPEDKHFIVKASSSEDSVDKVGNFFSEIIMDHKPKEKKRSSSFRKILSGNFFGKEKKKGKKNDNVAFTTDNVHNESSSFSRNIPQRHTVGSNKNDKEIEERFARMHINKFNEIKNNFSNPKPWSNPPSAEYVPMDNGGAKVRPYPPYGVNKYIDTSSSSSTTDSIKYNTYENALIARAEQRSQNIKRANSLRSGIPISNREKNEAEYNLPKSVMHHSPDRFSATPPRAQETYQNLQLVKPKALIPINSERPLPNPFQDRHSNRDNRPYLDDTYGTVFDSIEYRRNIPQSSPGDNRNRSLSPQYRRSNTSSPRSPSLEGSKLKLPVNREKIELQPRIKSPIPQTKVSTDKIIATELLKTRNSPTNMKKSSNSSSSPSHQNLENIDYPDHFDAHLEQTRNANVKTKPPISPKKLPADHYLEAAEWQRKQKEIEQYPLLPITTTDAVVHSDPRPKKPIQNNYANYSPMGSYRNSSPIQQQGSDRSITPVNRRLSTSSLQMSPEKQEMRQNVEAFYWKELKRLKEKEEMEYYYQLQRYGYADDTLLSRRSRSSTPSLQRNGRRSLSLPRDVRPQKIPNGDVMRQPETIPEDGVVLRHHRNESPVRGEPIYGQFRQQFVRNTPERSTIGPIGLSKQNYYSSNQRPIFKRGSLNNQDFIDSQNQGNKKVSFIGPQNSLVQIWPTKNGYMQSPPQRRVDDEVFLPNSSRNPQDSYGYNRSMNNNKQVQKEEIYNQRVVAKAEDIYVQRINLQKEPVYGQFVSNGKEPLYIHSPSKQITVSNKVCDIYGKIHDSGPPTAVSPQKYPIQQSGVLYGQLHYNPNTGSPIMRQNTTPSNFVRGSRLTASANDMYSRMYQVRDPRYRSDTVFESVYERQPLRQGVYMDDKNVRPLPPVPTERTSSLVSRQKRDFLPSDSARAGLPRRQYMANVSGEEEWNPDGGKSGRGGSGNESGGSRGGENDGELRGRSRSGRREDPRRHTLGGSDQQYGLMAGQGGPLSRTMDLEGQPRGYPPPSNAMLFDDDPGIMSEVETSSTGFRRGGKQRSSLPVVRTPSKTLERPLGLVFLQYRNETKRALLPNEITSIDTVKALFVRSFPKQLTMEYLDSPQVKIYIHDSSKDMFYELEDLRSHLREIRDRSVLRLFESADVSGGLPMAGIGIAGSVGHFEDPSYFSEPEFDSEYQHQHIHKSKGSAGKAPPYYMGSTASLQRGAPLLRTYSPAVGTLPSDRLKSLPSGAPPKPQRAYASGDGPSRTTDRFAPFQRSANSLFNLPDGYMSSPERGSRGYEDPYYSQYTSRSGSITPVIDEEISDTELLDDSYSLYGVKLPPGGPRPAPRSPFPPPTAVPYDATRLRVENMERQLANLTGLVQKALTQTPTTHLQVPAGRENYRTGDEFDMNSSSSSTSLPDDSYLRSDSKAPKLGKSGCHKSVSFEKSVSFSDEPPDMSSPKQHSPQHAADTKPPKPAIKSSTLPRTSSQERDRLKPAPPPKPASLSPGQYDGRHIYRDLQLTPEMYNQLRGLQKKAKDLRAEVRNLRRMSQAQAHSVRETIRDTFIKIRAMLLVGGEQVWQAGMDQERVRLSREEDLYKQEMLRLEKDLSDLESTVEELRGNVINRKTRVNMSDVESMALVLSKSSKTVADLKLRFPGLQDGMKAFLSSEMEKVVREEKFLKEEPERLESALRRCKKLTGTLVTLKRLASVQEQRLPCSTTANDGRLSPTLTETPPVTPTSAQHSKSPSTPRMGSLVLGGDSANSSDSGQRPENALDALLDELQTFSKPHPSTVSTQMPQVSYPAESDSNEPPAIPVKGIPPSNHPTMSEIGRKGSMDSASFLPTQNLTVSTATGSLRRLHSYPSGSDTDNSPPIQPLQRLQVDCNKTASKPPIPERNSELLQHIASGKRVPPPPPPRTSSKSPLASPTSPSLPPRSPAANLQHIQNVQNMVEKPQSQFEAATQNLGLGTLRRNTPNRSSIKDKAQTLPRNIGSNLQLPVDTEVISASNSSSCESVNSQDGSKKSNRKEELEQRHQELLKKQKALQEQYARLQQLQRGGNTLAVVPPAPDQLLKKTGSESNLLQKMGLQMSTTQMTGSLTNLPNTNSRSLEEQTANSSSSNTTTSKVYETDIL